MARNNRQARRDSYLRNRGAKNKRFLLGAFFVLVLAIIGFLILNSMMDRDRAQIDKDIVSGRKKLEEVTKEIEELKEDYEMRNTDEFKEKMAKEKLGMVKKGQEENQVVKPPDGNQANPAENQTNDQNQNTDSQGTETNEQAPVNQDQNQEVKTNENN
uniref:FtsB family cell division protein n=1 Tax=Anaerococcus mediterraneensis TaxID=1870984 RepID=UPI000931BA79|nr:septum formation initiator family protein [Anaerococcus mediterraneensis]